MSLSADQLITLMALADGELEGDERAEAEALVASNDDARRAFETMRGPASNAVAEWVASSQLERADGIAESIAGAVMDRIAKDSKRAPVVSSLEALRARRDARLKASAMIVAVASLAAGVLFYLGSDREKAVPLGPGPIASAPATSTEPHAVPMPSPSALASADPAQPASDEPAPGPEVTIESSTSHDVTVFHVPASIGAAVNSPGSVIVWIGDDKPQGK